MSEAEKTSVFIQAEITGYAGPPINLLAALDVESGLVMVARELSFGERFEKEKVKAMVTTNNPRTDGRDRLFSEDRLQDSIRMYYRALAASLIEFIPAVSKHNPSHRIEAAAMGEHGARYVLTPDMTNGSIAVLALLDLAETAMASDGANNMAREMSAMFLSI